jgi:methionine-rich copper-binding protein CopC
MSVPSASAPPRRLATVLAAGFALTFALCAALLTSVISAGPASAHAVLLTISPAANAKLTAAPAQVVLKFDDPVSSNFATVLVTDAAGRNVAKGKPTVLGAKVTQALSPDMASGAYRIAYQVTSDDGHPVSGQSRFTLQRASGASAATSPRAPSGASAVGPAAPLAADATADHSGWLTRNLVPVAAAGLLVIGVGLVLLRRRRQ